VRQTGFIREYRLESLEASIEACPIDRLTGNGGKAPLPKDDDLCLKL
jgi:hypothetical protein